MNEGKIAVRYAKAVFLLASEENMLDKVLGDFRLIQHTLAEVKELKDFLMSPIITGKEKIKVLDKVFTANITKITKRFVSLLIENKREMYLPSIIRMFKHRLREYQGIKTGMLTTAIEMDEALKKRIVDYISKKMKYTIDLETGINEKIIGGFILRIEDQQIDTSVQSKLNKIRKTLLNN